MSINYSTNFRLSEPTRLPNMLDSETFAYYWNDAAANAGEQAQFSDEVIEKIKLHKAGVLKDGTEWDTTNNNWRMYTTSFANTNWFKQFYRKWAPAQEHNLSVRGGSEKMSYYFSAGWLNQEGLIRYNTDIFDRYSLNGKISAQILPYYEVAHFILEDLDKAISMLKSGPVEGKNRISKEVAQLFRSRVALYEGTWLKYHKGTARVPGGPGWPGAKMDYLSGFTINIDSEIDYFLTEAMASAKEVAEKFSLTDNNHNVDWTNTNIFDNPYFKMFGDVNMTGYSEILLWRQYNSQFIGHHTMGYLTQGANSGYTKGFVDTFLMKSGLPYYAAGTDYKGDVLIKNVRENRDERLQLFMRAPGDYIVTKNPNKIAPDPGLLEIKENRSVTGYDVVKGVYNDIAASSAEILSTSGCIIFRATEAYLNYIEASYEKEGALNGTALNYWGQLRTRAGLPADPNVTIAVTDLDKENDWAVYSAGAKVDPTLYNIRRERRCELIAEGMRWADLRRWCALDQVKNYQIEGVNLWAELYKSTRYKDKKTGKDLLVTLPNANPTVSAKSVSTYLRPYQIVQANNLYYNGYTWTPAHYLSPIPYDNFWLASHTNSADNSVIYQNPGWPIAPNRGAL